MAAMRLLLHLCLLASALAGVAAPGSTTASSTPCPSANGYSHCGYPGLGLECCLGTPVLRLPSGEYGVSSILYGDDPAGPRTLSVFDLAATSNGSCPEVSGRNLTLPAGSPPPLSLTNRDRNLTFLLSCRFTGFATDHLVRCLQHGHGHLLSYVFREANLPYQDARLCQQVVGMPVVNPAADDLVAALRTGFELSWSAPADGGECAACEMAGGLCGQLREVERWVFTCIKPTSPASKPTSPASPATGPVGFSLMGMMLLLGSLGEMW